jgi:hypothetical protein
MVGGGVAVVIGIAERTYWAETFDKNDYIALK